MAATPSSPATSLISDRTRCPGCNAAVPAIASQLARYECTCGKWELETGLLVIPNMGPAGDPPAIVKVSNPLWKQVVGHPKAVAKQQGKGGELLAETHHDVPQHITLDQMAAMVSRSKRTLEKLIGRKKNPLPDPDIPGGGGKPNEWLWERIRPWLEGEYGRQLPETFPTGHH